MRFKRFLSHLILTSSWCLKNKIRSRWENFAPSYNPFYRVIQPDFSKIKPNSVLRCSVYLMLPWLGDISDRFANQISAYIRKCYFSSNMRVFFCTRVVLTSGRKYVLPSPKIVDLWFILLDVFAVHNTWGEPINVWKQELNMYPQKYRKGTTSLTE